MKHLLSLFVALFVACSAQAGGYVGDYAPGDTIDCNFGTVRPSTGASFTLAGTPAVSAYKDNSTTQSTAGITLSADFDSVTGLNHVRVTTVTDGTFYSAGSFHELIITTGTVDSVSVTGQPVCSFSLGKVAALRPATAGRTIVVSAGGTANADMTAISTDTAAADALEAAWDLTAGPVNPLGILRQGTAQSATGTTLVMDSGASFADDTAIGMTIVACGSTQGYCQSRAVTDSVLTTDTLTVATWTVTPSGTITYYLFGTAPVAGAGGGDATAANQTLILAAIDAVDNFVDTEVGALTTNLATANANIVTIDDFLDTEIADIRARLPAALVSGRMDSSTGAMAANVMTAAAAAADLTTELQTGLATASALSTVAGYIDTEIATLLIGVNVSKINTVTLCGAGTGGDLFRGC